MTREVLKLALEFCEFCWRDVSMNEYAIERLEQTITEIREALAKQEAESHLQAVADFGQLQEQKPDHIANAGKMAEQEPAFYGFLYEEECCVHICYSPSGPGGPNNELPTAYYTSPPKREWVGLTEEEYQQIQRDYFQVDQWRGIEAKLKEKNDGN
jgi:hypothetical protein